MLMFVQSSFIASCLKSLEKENVKILLEYRQQHQLFTKSLILVLVCLSSLYKKRDHFMDHISLEFLVIPSKVQAYGVNDWHHLPITVHFQAST